MATGISVDQTLSRLSTWLSGAAFTGLVALAHLPASQPMVAPQVSAEVKNPAPLVVPQVSAEQPSAKPGASAQPPPMAAQPSSIAPAPSDPASAAQGARPVAAGPPSAPGSSPPGIPGSTPGEGPAVATAAPVNPPVPETWTNEELHAGLRQCLEMLAPAAVEMELEEPMRRGACGTPAPLALRSVGGAQKVEFSPPPTMNCRLAASLSAWVEKVLQPAAEQTLGSRVTRILGASSYSCRNIYNNPKLTMSEHATGNAIDIAAFVTADGRTISVAKGWGPTERDIAAARKKAAERDASKAKPPADEKAATEQAPAGEKPAEKAKPAEGEAGKRPDPKEGVIQKVDYRRPAAKDGAKASDDTKAPAAGKAAAGTDANLKPATTKEAVFLKRLHGGSCSVFATVLGPEANEAHRDHFHLDMKVRRSSHGICH